jgi:predicted nucleic acid-binding protein
MPGMVAALDADVLVPILACDFLLTAFDHGLYEPVVSTTVLVEVERALSLDFPRLDHAAVTYRVEAMRDVLSDHLVEPDPSEFPEAVNFNDRHVVAAALRGRASVVVTNDKRLRREIATALPQLAPLSLDEFAVSLWDRDPDETSGVIDAMVAKRTSPPAPLSVLLERLESTTPSLVSALRGRRQ